MLLEYLLRYLSYAAAFFYFLLIISTGQYRHKLPATKSREHEKCWKYEPKITMLILMM